jgi:arylsulfatase A-like enzyme
VTCWLTCGVGNEIASAADAAASGKAIPPNVVFILADDLGYGELGCYGQTRIKTPFIDRLASQGTRFTDFYAGSTVCAPSRCALMTGLHMGHARIRGNKLIPLQPDDVTVAEVLKQAGYRTGIFGKWGLGEPDTSGVPNRQGFDEWFGYLNQHHAHGYFPDYLWHNETKFPIPGNVQDNNVATRKETYSPDLILDRALAFLDSSPRDKPFFLYLAVTLPHVNNELTRATGDGHEIPSYEPYANEDWPQPEKGRAAMVTRLDRDVGRMLDRLRELKLDDNTIVLFSSDNGAQQEGGSKVAFFQSSGPLRGWKRDLYEGGIRVPMIVRWPGKVAAGRVSRHVWSMWDFLPTMAELVGIKPPLNLDGRSMWPAIVATSDREVPSKCEHEFLYWEFHERGFTQAVRSGQWKAVRAGLDARLELYDLATDIGEKTDIAARHPDVVAKFEIYLKTARTDHPDFPIQPRAATKTKASGGR